jgi:hypothetical protein
MQRDDILHRYRLLRAIGTHHHTAALNYVARPTLLERAKHLGLAVANTLVFDSDEEMTLIFDLAIHTAKPGRSRAIDRYARAVSLSTGSDEANTLAAMRQAQFSIWRVERRHDLAGIEVTDVLRDRETWLLDEGLTASAPPGMTFAARLSWPAEFAMTSGVVVPVERALLAQVMLGGGLGWMRHSGLEQLADDPRFATALYRAALRGGVMENVVFQEPALAD